MENSRLYQGIWRFNGFVIALAGVMALLLMGFIGYQIFKDSTRKRNVNSVVNVEDQAEVKQVWAYGNLDKIDGTDYVVLPLETKQDYDQSYSRKHASSVRNYLFINTQNNQQHWLLKQNSFLIDYMSRLYQPGTSDKKGPAVAWMYKIIKSDTNDDGRISKQDKKTYAFSSLDGRNYKEVLTDIEELMGDTMIKDNVLMLMYLRQGKVYSAKINLLTYELFDEQALPEFADAGLKNTRGL